jgi:hypothetical protein
MPTRTKQTRGRAAHREGPSLDRVRAALDGVGHDVRTGTRDLYGNVETFVRSMRRDTVKLGRALSDDASQLVKATVALDPPTTEPLHPPKTTPRRRAARAESRARRTP